MKKVILAVLAILLVFALAAAAGFGLAWYRSTNVFLEGDVYPLESASLDLRDRSISMDYYNALQKELPYCQILWMVPFQGGYHSSDSQSLAVTSFTEADARLLETYFPYLNALDATGCRDYALLVDFQARNPNCDVIYRVDLGGSAFPLNSTELDLNVGEYTLEDMLENLPYLPRVTSVVLRQPVISLEAIAKLEETYPDIHWSYTVELLGTEYDGTTTTLDLSTLTAETMAEVVERLPMLPALETVELMADDGTSSLSKEDVRSLVAAAPQVKFHYTFDFFGTTLSTDSEEVILTKKKIGDAGEAELRMALDLMSSCKRFVLDNCGFSNEVLAKVREDYRDQTKVVWRITFGQRGSCLTDSECIRSTNDHLEKNYSQLKYCEDAIHIDFGHNENLTTCEFVAYMPNLESIILSGSSIRDLSPFRNCKKLKFLEIVFCGLLTDLSPLAECASLEMLNIGNIRIKDLTPLDNLPLTHFSARWNPSGVSKIPAAQQTHFKQKHPDCWTTFSGAQPYGTGWRYDTDQITKLPYYAFLVNLFDLTNNNGIDRTGFYLKDAESRLN